MGWTGISESSKGVKLTASPSPLLPPPPLQPMRYLACKLQGFHVWMS